VKNCHYCGSEIAESAVICPACKYHQSTWRNLVLFFAGITGFITLMVSGFTFIADRATELYKNMTWKDDVRVVSLTTALSPNFSVVISNVGSGPVFVSDIVVHWRGGNSSLHINERINAGEFLKFHDIALPGKPNYNAFVHSLSGVPSQGVLNDAARDEEGEPNKRCFLVVYFLPDSNDIERMNKFYSAHGRKLAVDQASARISFFSLHSRAKIQTDLPVSVTFVRSSADRCQGISFD
jgi:hypothetical protein